MLRYCDLAEASACRDRTEGCRVAVGYFDGLHIGHQHLIRELRDWAHSPEARSNDRSAAIVTFDRHPLEVLQRVTPLRILSREHRFQLLERHGIDAVLELPFTAELASWSADEFVQRVLRDALGAQGLLMGFDGAFGRGREGTYEALNARRASLGLEVRRGAVERLGSERVSSTLVRRAIVEGDLPRLHELLGRSFSLLGVVVRGDGRGRELGIPTANLNIEGAAALPSGVYFAYAHVAERVHGALVNIGVRPTFAGSSSAGLVIEAHLLEFDDDLYDERVELEFVKRHRGERRFPSSEALKAQIHADREAFLSEVPAR